MASLTLLAALLVAWSAHRTLGPVFAGASEVATFAIRVRPPAPSAAEHDVTIAALVVDGRRLRWDEVGKEGTWIEVPAEIPLLAHPRAAGAAAITFRGRSALCTALPSRGGRIVIERDGKTMMEVNLARAGTPLFYRSEIVLDCGTPRPGRSGFWLFLLLAEGLAVWLAPWRSARAAEIFVGCHALSLHLLVWATQPVATSRDSHGYLTGVHELFKLGFPSYFPPGTSILIGLAGLIPFGPLGLKVTLLQHVMLVLAVLFIHRLLRQILGHGVAFLAALVLGSSWSMLFIPQQILSEPLTVFGMTGALYFGVRHRDRGSRCAAILAGLLAGWAGLARVVPLIGSTLAFFCLHLGRWSRTSLRRCLLPTLVSMAVMAAPLGWYYLRSGQLKLSSANGYHLFLRMVTAERQLAERGPITHQLLKLLDFEDPRGRDVWDIYRILVEKGLNYFEISELLGQVSLEALRQAPWHFVGFTFAQAGLQYLTNPRNTFSRWGETRWRIPEVENPPLAPFTMSSFQWELVLARAHDWAWPWLCGLSLAGALAAAFLRRWRDVLALVALVLGYLMGTAAASLVVARYSLPLVPFMIALAAIPIGVLCQRIAARGAPSEAGPRSS